jgi:hypothetical protein
VKARSRFASPDRFIPQRSLHLDKRASYQTSTPPVLLRGRERNKRQRDNAVNPFRSVSETRSRDLTRQRNSRNAYNLRPPHFVPSFVHGRDATPAHVDPGVATRSLRQISAGFWTVGGRLSVQTGQLQGIDSGAGSLIASGTTAPLHTATFLDQATPNDKVEAHQRRLALALDIDQTNRILPHSSVADVKDVVHKAEHSPFVWKDSAWTRDRGPGGMDHLCASLSRPCY